MIGLGLTGRLVTAACGHPGQHVVGQYVECLVPGCDGLAGVARCKKCQSSKIEPFNAPLLPPGAMHCVPCGHAWWDGFVEDDGG